MELVELGKIFKISSGGTPSRRKVEYYENGSIPWVKTGDLKPKYIKVANEKITSEGLNNSSAKLFPKETVLIAMYGATIGETSILAIEACTNQACAAFYPNKKCLPEYLYYFFKDKQSEIIRMGVGGAQPNISAGLLKGVKIPLPPLETQKKIAAILDEADKLRQLDKQLIEKYDAFTQSLFLDMFGEKGKYKQVIIEDIVTKITDGTHHTPKYTDSGVPFLRVTDITKSNDSKKFISRDEHEQLIKRCTPEKGDVLYTKNGTIGIAKLVDWDYEFSIFVSLCLLKPRHDLIHNKFLESFLNTPFALKQAMRHSKTGTITNLHLTEIKIIKIPLPSMEIQLEFVSKVQAIETQKALAQKSLEKSEDLFNSLLQKAFKGELVK